ncbi:MAG: hypothetical protein IJ737_06720, partial [Ruminococcus sp.]|nr:hypothetical protein [Ruminococcus sp.]
VRGKRLEAGSPQFKLNRTPQLCPNVPPGINVKEVTKAPTSPRGRTLHFAALTIVLRGGGNKKA